MGGGILTLNAATTAVEAPQSLVAARAIGSARAVPCRAAVALEARAVGTELELIVRAACVCFSRMLALNGH